MMANVIAELVYMAAGWVECSKNFEGSTEFCLSIAERQSKGKKLDMYFSSAHHHLFLSCVRASHFTALTPDKLQISPSSNVVGNFVM